MRTLFILILFIPLNLGANKTKINLLSLDWKPYVGKNLKHNGFITYIIKRSLENMGVDVEISYYPFARALKEARLGKVHGYFPEYENRELENDFKFVSLDFAGPVGFMRRKGTLENLKIQPDQQDFSELKGLKVGVVRSYTNTEAFDKADYLRKTVAGSDIENMKKLYLGRIDMLFIDRYVGDYIMEHELKKDYPDIKSKLEFMEPALENRNLYLCFSKKHPMYEELSQKFEKGFMLLKKSGEFEQIIKNYTTYLEFRKTKLKTVKKLTLN